MCSEQPWRTAGSRSLWSKEEVCLLSSVEGNVSFWAKSRWVYCSLCTIQGPSAQACFFVSHCVCKHPCPFYTALCEWGLGNWHKCWSTSHCYCTDKVCTFWPRSLVSFLARMKIWLTSLLTSQYNKSSDPSKSLTNLPSVRLLRICYFPRTTVNIASTEMNKTKPLTS